MPYFSRKTTRSILFFVAILFSVSLLKLLPWDIFSEYGFGDLIYGSLIIAWIQTIRYRILQKPIRKRLIIGALLLLLLFLLRSLRLDFPLSPFWSRFLWYMNFLSITIVPLLSFDIAGKIRQDQTPPRAFVKQKTLWIFHGVFLLVLFTNDLHGQFAVFDESARKAVHFGPLFYLVIAAVFLFTLLAGIRLYFRCQLSASRRLWYVPMILLLISVLLFLFRNYVPAVSRYLLLNNQELFAFLFISLWESCIQIGLIPSNSDYERLFELTHLNVQLRDTRGNIVYRSCGYKEEGDNGEFREQKKAIRGGEVIWHEDIRNITELNEALEDAAERIEEENTLLEQENAVTEVTVRYEMQNRLYDEISEKLRPQFTEISRRLSDKTGTDELRDNLAVTAYLCAFVKRRANLELLSASFSDADSAELMFSLRESLDYLVLCGTVCRLEMEGERSLPLSLICLAYDLFEAVTEAVLPQLKACLVTLDLTESFVMTLVLDTDGANVILPPALMDRASGEKTVISRQEEEGLFYIRMKKGEDRI